MLHSGLLALIGLAFKQLELNLGLSAVLVQSFVRQNVFLSLSILNKFVEGVISVKIALCPRAKVVAELGHGNTVPVGLRSPFWTATDHIFLCIILYLILIEFLG